MTGRPCVSRADLRSREELTQSLGDSAPCISHPGLRGAPAPEEGGRERWGGGPGANIFL